MIKRCRLQFIGILKAPSFISTTNFIHDLTPRAHLVQRVSVTPLHTSTRSRSCLSTPITFWNTLYIYSLLCRYDQYCFQCCWCNKTFKAWLKIGFSRNSERRYIIFTRWALIFKLLLVGQYNMNTYFVVIFYIVQWFHFRKNWNVNGNILYKRSWQNMYSLSNNNIEEQFQNKGSSSNNLTPFWISRSKINENMCYESFLWQRSVCGDL